MSTVDESPWPSVISDVAREVMRRHHGQTLVRHVITRVAIEIMNELHAQLYFDPRPSSAGFTGLLTYCREALSVAIGQELTEAVAIDRAAALAQTLVATFTIEWDDTTQPYAPPMASAEGSR